MIVKSSFKKLSIKRFVITLEQRKAWSLEVIILLVCSILLSSCTVKPALNPLLQADPQAQTTPSCETTIIKTILDPQQNLIIAGRTNAPTLPTKNAFQKEMHGESSGFIARISPKGEILWCSYLGGFGSDLIQDMFIDSNQQLVVLGASNSRQYPIDSKNDTSSMDSNLYFFKAQMTLEGEFLDFMRINLPPLILTDENILNATIHGNEDLCIIINHPWLVDSELHQQEPGSLDPLYQENVLFCSDYHGKILWTHHWPDHIYNIKQVLLDAKHNSVYIAGWTSSNAFPLVHAVLSEYTSPYQSNAFLTKMDYYGQIKWSTFLWNKANDDSIADSLQIDEKGFLYVGGRISTYPQGKDCSAGNLSVFGFPVNSALFRIVDQEGRFQNSSKLDESNYPFDCWITMRRYLLALNAHNSLAISCNVSSLDKQEELAKFALIHPYQALPFGPNINPKNKETNILYKVNKLGEIEYSTYFGGAGVSSFTVEDVKLSLTEHMFVVGSIHTLPKDQAEHLKLSSEAFDQKNLLAFVTIFDPEGKKINDVLFGVDE